MNALVEHAKRELALLGSPDDEMQQEINANLLKIVEMFTEVGHSGSTAAYTIGVLTALLDYRPITPLRGTDDEWHDPTGTGELLQNIRCGRVFKDKAGAAWDIEAVVFQEPNGNCYVNGESKRFIAFPYVPHTEFVDAPKSKLILPGGNA